jgi:predicted nucleotidyltransferase
MLFATISGAHLYGFPSEDSDWDLRGCHILPATEVLGLEDPKETVEVKRKDPGFELDLVTHDAAKFFRLLLRKNGYVLEQLYSPLVVAGGDAHEELMDIGEGCITRNHVHHYLGFARNQWDLFSKDDPPCVKPLLYVYRILLTGIHLMRTGEVEANIVRLNEDYRIPGIPDLVALKTDGREKATLTPNGLEGHEARVYQLLARLEDEGKASTLREAPECRRALSEFLVRLRLGG